jgi:hypothetical protein
MRYTGLQPQYFPRLHYFARILQADIFMIREDVQFVKKHTYPDGKTGKSYQADTPIKSANTTQLLAIPTKHDGFQSIKETNISYDVDWVGSHLKTLQINYAKAVNFNSIFEQITLLLTQKFIHLSELNIATMLWGIMLLLGETSVPIEGLSIAAVNAKLKDQNIFPLKEIKLGSQSKALSNTRLERNEKIIAVMKEVGATEDYCGGTALSAYMNVEEFKQHGIQVTIQEWESHPYHQLFTKQQGFVGNLSIIDLFFNEQAENWAEVLKKGVVV